MQLTAQVESVIYEFRLKTFVSRVDHVVVMWWKRVAVVVKKCETPKLVIQGVGNNCGSDDNNYYDENNDPNHNVMC